MKKRWMLGFLILAVILMGVVYVNIGLPWKYFEAKNAFHQHLSKYRVEMVLEEVNYDFMHGGYHGRVHPKNNPDLNFYIGRNLRTNIIEDSYADQQLRTRANQEVDAILNKYLPNRIQPGPEVEVVDFETKTLEINVITKKPVNERIREKIVQAIIERGFKPEQLFFETKCGG